MGIPPRPVPGLYAKASMAGLQLSIGQLADVPPTSWRPGEDGRSSMSAPLPIGAVAGALKACGESVAVAEGAIGGLVSAALLALPGASPISLATG